MSTIRPIVALLVTPVLFACPAQLSGGVKTAAPTQKTSLDAGCAAASLQMEADRVIGSVDGAPVKAADLGPALVSAEETALREYCSSVSNMRQQALNDHVNELLVKRQAEQAGLTVDAFVQSKVEAAMAQAPTDADIEAFYQERAGPGAPPLEEVRSQVISALQREQASKAIERMLAEAKAGAVVTMQLPDIRPPAVEVKILAHTATSGPADAVVDVVEFADFECPYCSMAAANMETLKQRFAGQKVRFAYRHFPLSFHPNARRAAEFSQCAHDQGKFWELHGKIYANAKAMDEASLKTYVTEVGLDEAAFDACLRSGKAATEVEQDMQDATGIGVNGTPTFYVNGRKVDSPTVEALEAAIKAELAGA